MEELIAQTYNSDRHLAHRLLTEYGWDNFIKQLNYRAKKQLIWIKRQSHLVIYNYSEVCKNTRCWDQWLIIARGLILNTKTKSIIATTFPRFFEFNHLPISMSENLKSQPVNVSQKLDGSFISLFYDGNWQMASRFGFQSPQVKWASQFIPKLTNLETTKTYLFEVIYVKNNIVVEYKPEDEGLYLIGCYDNQGYEYHNLIEIGAQISAQVAPIHNFNNVAQVLEQAQTLPANQEGYVCRLENGLRFKVKGQAYLDIFEVIKSGGMKRIWQEIRDQKTIKNLLLNYKRQGSRDYIIKQSQKFLTRVDEIIADIVHDFKLMYYPAISYQEMIAQKIKLLPQLSPHASQCFRLLTANVKLEDDLFIRTRDVCWDYLMTQIRTEFK